jgi:chromate reductase
MEIRRPCQGAQGRIPCGMATPPRILAFSASARKESLNRKLLAAAVEAVRAAGGEVTLLDLNDYVLPLYHGDLEDASGLPANAVKLIGLITQHSALLIASPEYNSMFTPLLKNTIDWCTRGDDNPFEGKVAAVVSASPGALGGVRSLQLAQQLLLKLGCHVVPGQTFLPHADKAFDAQGALQEPHAQKAVQALAAALVRTVTRLAV